MRLLGNLLLLCVMLAAIRAAVAALLISAGLAATISLLRRPRETLLALLTIGITLAFVSHPIIVACLIGISAIASRSAANGAA